MAQASYFDMTAALIEKHFDLISDIILLDLDGMKILPEEGGSGIEKLVAAIVPHLQAGGWHITSVRDSHVLIEKKQTTTAKIPVGELVVHASFRSSRASSMSTKSSILSVRHTWPKHHAKASIATTAKCRRRKLEAGFVWDKAKGVIRRLLPPLRTDPARHAPIVGSCLEHWSSEHSSAAR